MVDMATFLLLRMLVSKYKVIPLRIYDEQSSTRGGVCCACAVWPSFGILTILLLEAFDYTRAPRLGGAGARFSLARYKLARCTSFHAHG